MSTLESLDDDREDVIYLNFCPAEAVGFLDIPPRQAHVAEAITELLKQRAFHVHFLKGEDKPAGVAFPLGLWPYPEAEDLAAITKVAEMPVRTPEERAAEKQTNLSFAA